MGHADYLRNGDYNAICDRCGCKFKFSQLKLEWDGLYVCTANGCWEPRQPQDYVKGVRDDMAVPVSRPDQPAVFLDTLYVTPVTSTSLLSFAINRLKSLAVSVISTASILTQYFPSLGSKVLDGAPINTTTLG
jgi:hypothetical protein